MSEPTHTTKWRAKDVVETNEFKLVADLFDDLYASVGADDVCTSFWKRRATHSGTLSALTLKQFSYWDRVQHQLWRCQQKHMKKNKRGHHFKVSEAESRLWQTDWLAACKKLGH